MDGPFIWMLLFLGNAALMVLWLHYIVRVFFGRCPHCGESPAAKGLRTLFSRSTKAPESNPINPATGLQ
jgi:hypothetical protein